MPSSTTIPASAQSRAQSDNKIEAALTPLANLPNRQKSALPVDRLSDDVLFHIFSFLVQRISLDRHSSDSPHSRDLFHAARVCSRWRTVASSPSLWADIRVRTVRQTQELLSRSAAAPLRVAVHTLKRVTSQERRELLSPHFGRVQLLKIHEVSSRMGDWIALLAPRVPQLEALALWLADAPSYRFVKSVPDGWSWCKETPELEFGNQMPALRSLNLCGMFFPPGSPIFRNLRELHLCTQPACLVNSTIVAHLVSHTPQLETLEVKDVGMDPTEESIENTSLSTALPRLRTLTMHDVPPCFPGNLLDATTLPLTVVIDVRVRVSRSTTAVPIPRFTSGPTLTCVGARSVECTLNFDTRAISFRTRRDPAAPDPDVVLTLELMARDPICERVCAIFGERPLVVGSGIECYTLRYEGAASRSTTLDWETLLAEMGALRVLTVIDAPEKHLLELLDALRLNGRGRERAANPCMSLEAIHLQGVACSETFWRKLRLVAKGHGPVLRTIRILDARDITNSTDDLVRDVRGIVETLEVGEAKHRPRGGMRGLAQR